MHGIYHYYKTLWLFTNFSVVYLGIGKPDTQPGKRSKWTILCRGCRRLVVPFRRLAITSTIVYVSHKWRKKTAFNNCHCRSFFISPQAEIAGKISVYQLNLAMAFGDPLLVCRCKLYYSLSMMQKGYLRQAKRLILQQYEFAQTVEEYDDRLVKMCHGIWMKLQYAYTLRKRKRLAIS